jgi:hypothetical protein
MAADGAVAGFDLTLRAPKSVGIRFGIAEPEVTREIVAMVDAAGALDADPTARTAGGERWSRR